MKKSLLIITQTVDKNDPNLGFFCGWIKEFSSNLEYVYVIANRVGEYDLPDNVTILSLGKEKGIKRIGKIINFYRYLFMYLPRVDGVFAHMCPEYIVYGGWIARLYGKKLGLWYLHKAANWKLKIAHLIADFVFTAHIDGYPIKFPKVVVTGHGIDTRRFIGIKHGEGEKNTLTILTAGRISKSKNLLILVKSVMILQSKIGKRIKFLVVGGPYLKEDREYLEGLKKYVKDKSIEDIVEFAGNVPHEKMHEYYKLADIFLSASRTGGVDKAILEAMASGLPVITSNFAFKNILPDECLFKDGDLEDLIIKLVNYNSINIEELREIVLKGHSLENTVRRIIKNYE